MKPVHAVALSLILVSCEPVDRRQDVAPPPAASLVVYGRVWTGDTAAPWAGAVAVSGDSIVAVGDSTSVATYVGPSTVVIDNGRSLVVPGLMDGHTHFMAGGQQLVSVDLRSSASPAEFIRRLGEYAATRPQGEWILGGDWDHERWQGAPLPTRAWIDSVTPRNPVFINRLDGHMALANSIALRRAGIDASTRDVAGGTIVRDAAGRPTGILKDEAQNAVYDVIPVPSPAEADSAIARATNWAASKGIVGVSAVSSSWLEVGALKRARDRGALHTRVSVYLPLGSWREAAETLRVNGPGDEWVRVAGVKGYVDGSLGSGTALFYQPYADDSSTSGLLVTPEDSLRRWIGAADSAGLQVAVHAIGERANALLLSIYDSVARAHGARDRRFRIEHAQHLRPEDVPLFARLGVIASMQPYHAIDDGRWAGKRVGETRVGNSYVFRSLLDSGATLAFGSDWTVAPLDPVLGIYAAVTRQTLDSLNPGGWIPAQKISVDEALRAYTSGNAYAVFADARRGMLKPGYLADIVLLDRDLTTIRPEELEHAGVRATVVGGEVVFRE